MKRLVLPAALALPLGYLLLALPGPTVTRLLAEDGWVENLGALGLLCTGLAFAAAAARREQPLRLRLSLALLALLFWVGAGEEISWGQRIFGWGTPESLRALNVQQETNLHNLAPMQGWLDAGRLFHLFTFAFAVALPLLCRAAPRLRPWAERQVPVLAWPFALLFVLNQLLAKLSEPLLARGLYTGALPLVHVVTEVKESAYALLFALASTHFLHACLQVRTRPSPAASRPLSLGVR